MVWAGANYPQEIITAEEEQGEPDIFEVTNEHGVKGEEISRTFIPQVCLRCDHFEEGEIGDYGTVYSYPGCMLGMILPTRKGTCKRQETKRRRPVTSSPDEGPDCPGCSCSGDPEAEHGCGISPGCKHREREPEPRAALAYEYPG